MVLFVKYCTSLIGAITLMFATSVQAAGSAIVVAPSVGGQSASLKAKDIKKALGNMQVDNYNAARAVSALVGKQVDFTLFHPNAGETMSELLQLSSLKDDEVFFTCKDFPQGFPAGKASYKVTTKVSGLKIEQGPEGESMANIQLERCKN